MEESMWKAGVCLVFAMHDTRLWVFIL